MILKTHYIKIWLRTIGIVLTCIAIAFVVVPKPDWFYLINLLVLLAIQLVLFVRSQNIIARELEQLFDSLNCSDTTTNFKNKKKTPQFHKIYERFDNIMERIQELKLDSIQKNEYLSTLFEHINIGIISLSNNNNIQMTNSSARKILGKGNLKNIADIMKFDRVMGETFEDIKPNESRLVSIYKDGYLQHLSVRAALLKFQKEEIKIVSFQNIKSELDEREMDGWQKLIRVLTHELMNSAGPINSTISTIFELLTDDNQAPKSTDSITSEILADAIKGLKIIEERSKGIIDFVTRFRSLTLIPNPKLENLEINALIDNIIVLLEEEADKSGIKINNKIGYPDLEVLADKGMIEQILINLLKNSFEAVKEKPNPLVSISVWHDSNYVFIDITDNGSGISQNIQDKIFVPFFTTRKEGTGIGLSLSRQLANLQGGALALTKSTQAETIFTLKIKTAK